LKNEELGLVLAGLNSFKAGMITNPSYLDELLASHQRKEDLSFERKIALLEGMFQLAQGLGHFTPDRALEGIEHDIHLAASIHSFVRTTPR
jgi:hypothetical protein